MLEMQLFMNKRKKRERQNRMMEGDKITTTTTTWSKNLVEHTPTRWEEVGNGKGGKCKGQGKVAFRGDVSARPLVRSLSPSLASTSCQCLFIRPV